ncbi:MAG: response regulator transcription factor [Rhodospirillales bacterium]|nr:response regulator transcription factor [Rhodospirillales bacterium]
MAGEAEHILIVDDDTRLRELLHKYLGERGFMVTAAEDAAKARAKMVSISFDLIILDLMMPGESGLDFARSLRQRSDVPILMLTAMDGPEHRITGLEHGADDYLSKPFEPRELVLRIQSILRRAPARNPAPESALMGDVRFDLGREELWRGPTRIRLTLAEARLLKALAEVPGAILGRDELTERLAPGGGERTIDVQVNRLRRKIEPDPKLPRYLQTVRGQGYTLRPDPEVPKP